MANIRQLVDDFLVQTKRWPLLILSLTPAAFWFSKEYFGLTFHDTCSNWLFLWLLSVLMISAGISYAILTPKRLERWIVGLTLFAVGLFVMSLGLWEFRPAALPDDSLVVLVARFTPVTPGADDEARNVSDRIEQELTAKRQAGAPIQVRRTTKSIDGPDDQAKEASAIAVGKAHELSAHVVIWGEVRKDQNEISIRPHITLAQPLKGAPVQLSTVAALTFLEPQTLELNKKIAEGIADTVGLAYALAFFKVEQWDRAMPILREIRSPAARLYEGLCEMEKSRGSSTPASNWNLAIADFDKILGPNASEPTASSDDLTWDAYLNRANATMMVGLYLRPNNSLTLLQNAANSYKLVLNKSRLASAPDTKAALLLDLSVALRHESFQYEGPQRDELIKEATDSLQQAIVSASRDRSPFIWAVAEYTLSIVYTGEPSTTEKALAANASAAEVFTIEKYPWFWANTKNNSGVILKELGTRIPGEDGAKLLARALADFKEAYLVFTREKFPYDWALTKNNEGAALTQLAARSSVSEAASLLQRAELSLNSALEVRARANFPADWAITMTNLGAVQEAEGDRRPGRTGLDSLKKAIDAYEAALEIQTEQHERLDWANTQYNLGHALRTLGHHVGGREALPTFDRAINAYLNSERVRQPENFPEMWLLIQNNVGLIQCEMGDWILGNVGDQYIRKAMNTYEAASAREISKQFPETRTMILTNLGLAQFDLGARPSSARSTVLLRKAIDTYEAALTGYDFSHSPQLWSALKNNLGMAQRILAKRLNNEESRDLLTRAVESERNALRFRSQALSPKDWANSEENLGNALNDLGMRTGRAQGEKLLDEAISCFNAALSEYSKPGFETEANRVAFAKILTSQMLTMFHITQSDRIVR